MSLITTVRQHVSGEFILPDKFFTTLYTFMISNITVCQGMSLKLTLGYECFSTLLTLKLALCVLDGAACLKMILAITPAPPIP